MRAINYSHFQGEISLSELPDPEPSATGAVIKVMSTGLCRSDWHGWMGHDADINTFPHVPGHEFSGVIEVVGKEVRQFRPGQRVTVPFVCGCGTCRECQSGNQQVCDYQFQPGFTGWGSFADYVAIEFADVNLVELPEAMEFSTAASLGCRFSTAFRAVVAQAQLQKEQWFAIYGCGGVGLAAVMIASALQARVIAVDVNQDNLELAQKFGAFKLINARENDQIVEQIKSITDGGVHVALDALGITETCINGIMSLKKRGKHVQVGLMAGEHARPAIPIGKLIANELEIIGSHGMQAFKFNEMLTMIEQGKLSPKSLIQKTIPLADAAQALASLDQFKGVGMTMIDLSD